MPDDPEKTDPLAPLFSVPRPRASRPIPTRRDTHQRRRVPPRDPPSGLTIEEEAAWRDRESKRGKRFRGQIDEATQQWLDQMGDAADPPFLDQYEPALAETNYWLSVGFLDVSDIVRWRAECPGLSADDAWAFQSAGVTPRLARTRWDRTRITPAGDFELWRSVRDGRYAFGTYVGGRRLTVADAIWLLRQSKLIA